MQILLFSLGILIYFSVIIDIIQTTLSLQGGGWLTTRVSNLLWSIALKISGRDGSSKVLGQLGYILLVAIVFIWVFLLLLSFFLMLASTPDSVISSDTKLPAGLVDKIYYVGFTLSTLGVGDFNASNSFWRLLTTMYSFTGLIFLTMSVTYLIPALSAVMEQRKMGITISRFGSNAQDIVINSWDGKNFNRLFSEASNLSDSLIMHSQHHRSYPIIQYFHNTKKDSSNILQMARLYEALYIIRNCVKKELQPTDYELEIFLQAYKNYIEVILEVTNTDATEGVTPDMQLDKVKEHGLVLPSYEVPEIADSVQHTRRVLFTLVTRDGWDWNDIYHTD